MPLSQSVRLPPPDTWEELETIVWDLFRRVWKDPNAQKHGRLGQRQRGVDIIGRPEQGDFYAGVQVKLAAKGSSRLTDRKLRNEVEKVRSFTPALRALTVVTSAPNDATIQESAGA